MIRVLLVALRFLFVLFVVRLLAQFVGGVVRGLRGQDEPGRAGRRRHAPERAVELVRDPVCRTFLPRTAALRATLGGREVHFCSEACREQALRAAAVAR